MNRMLSKAGQGVYDLNTDLEMWKIMHLGKKQYLILRIKQCEMETSFICLLQVIETLFAI